MAQRLGLIPPNAEGAVDSTGFDTERASEYYRDKFGDGKVLRKRWPKLSTCVEIRTSFILSAIPEWGPTPDSPKFIELVTRASGLACLTRVLADKAYDAEHNHVACQRLGIPECLIPINRGHRGRKWPLTPLRRELRRVFHSKKNAYHRRALVESNFSRHKRRFGSVLRARSQSKLISLVMMRVLLHNVALLHVA